MPYLSKINLDGAVYNLKDKELRETMATSTTAGLMSARDKEFLDSLNPDMATTLTNINNSELQIINAKANNVLNMEIAAEPIIQSQIRTSNLLNVDVFTPGYYIGSSGSLASNANDRVGEFIPVSPGDDIYYTGIIGPTNSSSINRRLHVYKADKTWIKQISFAGSLKVGNNWSTHGIIPSNGAYIRVSWGVEDTNVMISIGAPTKYYPYYITPFTAITSASFAVGTTSDRSEATKYTIAVPAAAGDQYGFSYNPIEGKLYSSTGHIDSYNGETLPNIWWSDRDAYVEGTTPTIGAEVIYKLADEDIEEYDITPITIPLGQYVNYFFIDGGYLKTLSYYAQTVRVQHITIDNGISFGETNILESDIASWNNAVNELALKADINSPEFTGSPLSTNPGVAVNNNRIATTYFVQQKMNNIAPLESTTKASKNYEVGDYLFLNGQMYKVTAAIASGASLIVGTNIDATSVAEELKLLFAQI